MELSEYLQEGCAIGDEVSFHIDYEKDIVEYNREIITAIFECPLILQNYVITLRVFNEERTVNIYQPGSKEVNEPRKYVASWVAYNGKHAEEYDMIASALPSINGSSPRMRRSIFHPLNSFSRAWFIPAYAGNIFPHRHIDGIGIIPACAGSI